MDLALTDAQRAFRDDGGCGERVEAARLEQFRGEVRPGAGCRDDVDVAVPQHG